MDELTLAGSYFGIFIFCFLFMWYVILVHKMIRMRAFIVLFCLQWSRRSALVRVTYEAHFMYLYIVQ